jgi:hypothetical protein
MLLPASSLLLFASDLVHGSLHFVVAYALMLGLLIGLGSTLRSAQRSVGYRPIQEI